MDQQRRSHATANSMTLGDLTAIEATERPEEFQQLRKRQFWLLVGALPVKRWNPGDSMRGAPIRLLIGVAPSYCRYDIELIDLVARNVPADGGVGVDLFDATDLRSMSDLEAYIPGLKEAYHTPMVGVWRDGEFERSAEGFAGRQLVYKILGINS